MKRKTLAASVLGVAVLFSAPLFAHHGNAALDTSKKVVMKAVVTDWLWQNPHSILKFDVKDDSGKIVHWSAEINNPVRNGQPVGRIVQVVFPNGTTLNTQYLKDQ